MYIIHANNMMKHHINDKSIFLEDYFFSMINNLKKNTFFYINC